MPKGARLPVFRPLKVVKPQTPRESAHWVFCDRESGVPVFQLAKMGHEEVAARVAVHCLARGYKPQDLLILVPPDPSLVETLMASVNELLDEGEVALPVASLSNRQREILGMVVRNYRNKEIADYLHITVRTVKFHVSVLFQKFHVADRGMLARRATGLFKSALDTPSNGKAGEA